MPFTFKLSVRLARMKPLLVVAAAAFAACELPVRVTAPNPPNSPVVQIVSFPDSVTLDPDQTQQFVAYGRTQAGDSVAVTVSWNATGGTIATNGSYSADTVAGNYLVTATLQPTPTAPTAAASGTTHLSGSSRIKNRGLLAQVIETPSNTSVWVGRTAQFTAYGRTKSGDSVAVSVTWSSSNPTVATVSSTGLMTGMAAGSTTIIATSQNTSGTATATIINVPVASVTVGPPAASVTVGATTQLTATPQDANGTALSGRVVTWATSNAAVATVSATGLVTGVATGSATITATSEGQSGTSAITVTNLPVASVMVSPASATVTVGATTQLTATPKDANGAALSGRAVTWATSNPAVATVSAGGVVTGVATGSATITATSEGQTGTSAITVTNVPVASVTVSPTAAGVTVGATTQLTATPKDANGTALSGRAVTWATSNAAVATVSATGLVTGVATGSATITATSEGQSGTSVITVTNAPVASVTVSPTAAGVTVGATTQLTATPKDANGTALSGRVVTWATSNAAAATVSASGLVTGVAAGSATITATSEGQSGTSAITVTNVPVASVTVSPATASITVGAATQLTATPKDANGTALTGRAVTWATSNAAVATVSTTGRVTGVTAGSATITATSEGQSGTSAIAVTNAPVASVTVTPATANLLVGATLQLTATLKDALGNPLSGRVVTWASNAPGVAAVSGAGLVTGLGIGGGTITATSEGQSGSSAVTVSLVNDSTPLYTLGNGANYYIAPSGSDGNPCTATAPCYTLQRVSQLMSPGDNAHVAAGNYTWSYSGNQVTKSGTATAPISYISDTKWGAKIYGSDCSPITNGGDYVQIINFDVTGSCVQGITTNGNYTKIIGNRVHDMPGTQLTAAIVVDCCSYTKTGNLVIGNVVDNIGPWGQVNQTHGIYLAGPGNTAMNNIVTRAASACIQTYHGATRLTISNNVVANCGKYGIQLSADPAVTVNDYTTVDNNIIVNGGQYGIHEAYSLGSHIVYNNNIVYNNPAGNISGSTGIQSGTITLTSAQFSALFVNYTGDMTGDYHLRSGAVAIDAGTTLCATGVVICVPALDFTGIARPQGLAYDIGSYEWH